MNQKIAKVAVNTNIIDKNIGGNDYFMGSEWQNAEITIDELIQLICEGHPFCAQQYSDKRSSKNFKITNLISIDVDGGTTLRDALEHEFSKKHLTFFYTTPRHTIEVNRFRLCFYSEQDINDPEEYRAIKRALGLKYCGDPSTHDPSRISFGNSNAVFEAYDRSIAPEVLTELIELGKTENSSNNDENQLGEFTSSYRRSDKKLHKDMEIKTASGLFTRLYEFQETTPVYCPFHKDDNPSAFANRSINSNNVYIHCQTCGTTWWMESKQEETDRIDEENDFVETLRGLRSQVQSRKNEQDFSNINLKSIPYYGIGHIDFVDHRYLEIKNLHDGLTLIRSPKGSGKTESLVEIIRGLVIEPRFRNIEAIEEEDPDEPPRSYRSDKKILLIGHRQALISQLCKRLDLNCYLDDEKSSFQEKQIRKNQYGVCLDSLWRVENIKYDLVIIDECEQVLAHLLSKTMNHKEVNYKILKNTIKSANNVIALDADLDWTSYLTLTEMRGLKNPTENKNNQVWITINDYIEPNKEIHIFSSKQDLIGRMMEDVAENKKLFITSNSKSLIEKLNHAIVDKFGDSKTLCITSSNSKTNESQDAISDFNQTYAEYNNLLCSPSLGTGIDISFTQQEQIIDCCYGFFESQINTHLDIDQQIRRVRNPKEVRVWINPRKFQFETEFGVINYSLLANRVIANTYIGFNNVERSDIYNEANEFLTLATHIVSDQRKSKNNLKANFIKYKIKTGWTPLYITKDPDYELKGFNSLEKGRQIADAEHIKNLLAAKPICFEEYEEIKNLLEDNQQISTNSYWSLLRMNIELFYQRQISDSLVEDDNKGSLRKKVNLFLDLHDLNLIHFTNEYLNSKYSNRKNQLPYDRLYDREVKATLLHSILSTTPIFSEQGFDSSVIYGSDNLSDFIKSCKKHNKFIQTQFNFSIRSDVDAKPVTQLNFFLKLIGISIDDSKKKSGKYKILPESLDRMIELADMRTSIKFNSEWDAINKIHGFK
jgi:transcription elongation factor Elf1